jgi:hypothetical protein
MRCDEPFDLDEGTLLRKNVINVWLKLRVLFNNWGSDSSGNRGFQLRSLRKAFLPKPSSFENNMVRHHLWKFGTKRRADFLNICVWVECFRRAKNEQKNQKKKTLQPNTDLKNLHLCFFCFRFYFFISTNTTNKRRGYPKVHHRKVGIFSFFLSWWNLWNATYTHTTLTVNLTSFSVGNADDSIGL